MKTCDVEFLRQMHCIVRRLNEDDMLGFDSIFPETFYRSWEGYQGTWSCPLRNADWLLCSSQKIFDFLGGI